MSCKRFAGLIIFDCDECGELLDTQEAEFADALREKQAAGWGSRKDYRGEWEDVCDSCRGWREARNAGRS